MIAEYERAQISERNRRGKIHRARSGQINVLSGAPYGYRYIRKSEACDARYEIDEAQAVIVRQIFGRYVEEQVSIGELARWLTQGGILTAKGRQRWDRSTVWAILRNPAYAGRAAYGKTQLTAQQPRITRPMRLQGISVPRHPARGDRPSKDWISIPVPAIVSEETFALAGERLASNRRFARRRTKEPSLLQGLICCRDCGYAYYRSSTRTKKAKLYYYRCLGSDNYRFEHGRICHNRPIRQDFLDEQVWRQVTELISNPQLIRQELERRLQELASTPPFERQKSRLQLSLNKKAKARDRLIVAYQDELLTLEELREHLAPLKREEATLRAQLDVMEQEAQDRKAHLLLAESLEGFLSRLAEAATSSSIEERQKVLRLLVKEVLVGADSITIRHSIPSLSPDTPPGYLLRRSSNHPTLRNPPLPLSCRLSVASDPSHLARPLETSATASRVAGSSHRRSDAPPTSANPHGESCQSIGRCRRRRRGPGPRTNRLVRQLAHHGRSASVDTHTRSLQNRPRRSARGSAPRRFAPLDPESSGSRAHAVSERQARRYVEQAQQGGRLGLAGNRVLLLLDEQVWRQVTPSGSSLAG